MKKTALWLGLTTIILCMHAYYKYYRDIKLKQSEEIERLRHEFEERVREIERRYSTRYVRGSEEVGSRPLPTETGM